MFYLGIDQHARQITISLRDDDGGVLLARQVSTQPGALELVRLQQVLVDERTIRRRWRSACQRLTEALGGRMPRDRRSPANARSPRRAFYHHQPVDTTRQSKVFVDISQLI